jgi:hypothetical protein
MSMTKKASSQVSIKNLLDAISRTEKAAAEGDDPGSVGGKSTHPSADVDGNAQAAPEGFRSRENTEDVKEQVPASVDAAPDSGASSKSQEDLAVDIGMKATTTGKTPEVETASAKGTKEDPGTTHPADTENSSLNGGKYSADLKRLSQLYKKADDLAVDILSDFSLDYAEAAKVKQAAEAVSTEKVQKAAAEKAAAQATDTDAEAAGCDLAGVLSGVEGLTLEDKRAADEAVVHHIFNVVKLASDDADRLIEFYNGRNQAMYEAKAAAETAKYAQQKAGGRTSHKRADEGGSVSGASDTDDDEGERAGDGGDGELADLGDMGGEEDLLALLEGGGSEQPLDIGLGGGMEDDIGGEAALSSMLGGDVGGMGGDPGMDLGGGGDPGMGMEGVDPGMAMGGDPGMGGGGEGSPEDMAMLEQILQQLQVPPEALESAAAGKMAADVREYRARLKKAGAKPPVLPLNSKSAARYKQIEGAVKEILTRGRK